MGFSDRRIAVIGGGLSGLSFMNSALRAGLTNIHLYEAAPQFTEVGAGISISRNGNLVLDHLGLKQDVVSRSGGDPVAYMKYYHYRSGDFIHHIEEWGQPTARSIHRAHLLDALKEHVPDKYLSLNKRLDKVVWDSNKKSYIIHFLDNTTAEADIIIGCDGIKSNLRKHLGLTDNPNYSGQMVYRGFVSYDDLSPEVAKQLRGPVTNFRGPQRHILCLPIGSKETNSERVGVVGFMTEPLEDFASESWLGTAPIDDLYKHVKDWCPAVQELIAGLRKESSDGTMLKQTLYVRDPCSKWFETPPDSQGSGIVLVGDSVHSTLPHQGQGTNQAIESGYALGQILKSWDSPDLHSALKFFEDFRKPRTDRVTKTSFEMGKLASTDVPEEKWDEVFQAPVIRERLKWIHGYNVMEDLAEKLQKRDPNGTAPEKSVPVPPAPVTA